MAKYSELTETVYNFLLGYSAREGFPPTVREIAAGCHCGITTSLYQLEILESRELIARKPFKPGVHAAGANRQESASTGQIDGILAPLRGRERITHQAETSTRRSQHQ